MPFELGTAAQQGPSDHQAGVPNLIDQELLQQMSRIPAKLAFKIGEVAELVGVKQYVLRYWESEFEALRPKKSSNGQRIYTKKEVEMVMLIKSLLYDHRYSIEGAKSALKSMRSELKKEKEWQSVAKVIEKSRNSTRDLLNDLIALKKLF